MIHEVNDCSAEQVAILGRGGPRGRTGAAWPRWINGLAAVGSAGFGVAALFDPASVMPMSLPIGDGITFYAQMYAVRALSIAVVLLVALAVSGPRVLVPILVLAGLAQVGDIVIGLLWSAPGMVIGGGIAAVVHLATAVWLWHR